MKLPALPPPPPDAAGRIRVGPAGWSYADWEGIVYPASPPPAFDRLAWMARFFDVIEINSTFYRAARRRDAESWAQRVAPHPRFRFCAKLERVFTHAPAAETPASESAFKQGIEPLARDGRLAAVLVQFPYSFRNTVANRHHLARVLTRFGEYALALEIRHRSWISADILAFLSARGVALVGVDQPQIGQPVAPSLPLTGTFFYARLHGRNAANWFREGAGRDARYDYLYAREELAPWIDRFRQAAVEGTEGIVIANNHYRGQAVANAVEIRAALAGRKVPAPATLVSVYPRLEGAVDPVAAPTAGTPRLF